MKQKNIINGWLNVDKPQGLTSADVVNIIKKILRPVKIGHTGTLDPMATGVLPIALGEATKLIQFIENKRKTYEFRIVFGAETDTDDAEGKIIKKCEKIPKIDEILAILPQFIGKIKQKPPIYSALKINGVRAYELARVGKAPEMKDREVEVFELGISSSLRGADATKQSILISETQSPIDCFANARNDTSVLLPASHFLPPIITATVSRGTYIRTLAKDIAAELGTLGHIDYLRRTKDGVFELGNSSSLREAYATKQPILTGQITDPMDCFANGRNDKNALIPNACFLDPNKDLQSIKNDLLNQLSEIDFVLDDIPVLNLNSADALRLRQGQKIPNQGNQEGIYKLYNEGSLQAMVEVSDGLIRIVRGINL
ncbi:MAG TPA: tRNA pseudouridine(55) synthase TruB [Alphaproteobacteria bacterium]|nr:tRNA pseudouridine(55) synthase TruB [Alphaproteobacteria bacterium]